MTNSYDDGLDRNGTNYAVLTPLDFLERAAEVYPDRPAIAYGTVRRNWREERERAHRLASALAGSGIGRGDTVSVLLPNIPEMFDVHFGVPLCGAVLNTLNTRLDADTIAYILDYAEAKALIVDRQLADVARRALAKSHHDILVIDVNDPQSDGTGEAFGRVAYEAFLATGDPDRPFSGPRDEWDAISLNFTSGTTGRPKGVVYHHRGAYLNAISNALDWDMPRHPVYLWTLPMFHCNGWCFPWTIAARAGVNVFLRNVEAKKVLDLIRSERVTHYCGAPVVHNMLIDAPEEWRRGIDHPVYAMVAGAPPPVATIEGLEAMGVALTHVYGLTETYGPAALCVKQETWDALPSTERARRNARQGVRYQMQAVMTVVDPETDEVVPADGKTMGEVAFRGNITMKGYLKDPEATAKAFRGNWFHTGDLGVIEADGYVKIKDRAKDVIISGGENISSIEVEDALCRHPAVSAAAVVAKPDQKWGEVAAAFVECRAEVPQPSAEELTEFCRERLPRFAVPRVFTFGPLPRTSTGKVQKFALRRQMKSASAIDA